MAKACPRFILSFFPGARERAFGRCRARLYPKQFIRFFKDQTSSSPGGHAATARCRAGLRAADRRLQQRSSFPGQGRGRAGGHRAAARLCSSRMARNTAPAIAVAALLVERDDPDGILGRHAVGSCHQGRNELRCRRAPGGRRCRRRQAGAVRHRTRARRTPAMAISTAARPLADFDGAFAVNAFTEKPDRANGGGLSRDRRATIGTAASSCSACARFWTS